MILTQSQLSSLCQIAAIAAMEAGEYIASVDRQTLMTEHKNTGSSKASQIVTEVDRHCDQLIRQHLLPSCRQFDLGLLTEENLDACQEGIRDRFEATYFWCVDPLDGTLPFVQGRAGYAVAIALVARDGKPVVGVVYDPVTADLFTAIEGRGIEKNAEPIPTAPKHLASTLHLFADNSFKSHSHYPLIMRQMASIARDLGAGEINLHCGAGAVQNACQILDYPLACYFKTAKQQEGGGSLWDFAASACLINEAGGWVSNMVGQPLDLNRPDSTFMNHQGVLFASDQALAQAIIAMANELPATET
ncbi:MAG: hypothetical protein AseanaTS_00530 [Candidatus Pelagadaptatus aseana]|uniref:3'(2'),5'-bisphosphate nucleotidase CysQ family protein n=1 Tax=Candidatus Pelagadaptatus aseana TaxID=3120508 RepID=UPI0039B2E557